MRSPGPDAHRPLVGFDLPGKDLQEGRFAGAVGADKAVAVTGGELDIDVFKQNALAIGKRHIGCADHKLFLICVPLKGKPLKAALHFPISRGP